MQPRRLPRRCSKPSRWRSPARGAAGDRRRGHQARRSAGRCRLATRSSLSRPVGHHVSTSRRNWCSTARAGTPLAEIEALLAEHGQQFAFEPTDYGPLLGGRPAAARSAACSPRTSPARGGSRPARPATMCWAYRPSSGRGEAFKAGGRVVKNVTGYDLSKLLAGSWGTLAVLDRRHLQGAAEGRDRDDARLARLDDASAVGAMALAMGSAAEVSGAAHLPEHVARRADAAAGRRCGDRAAAGRLRAFGRLTARPACADPGHRSGRTSFSSASLARGLAGDPRCARPFAGRRRAPGLAGLGARPPPARRASASRAARRRPMPSTTGSGGLVWLRMRCRRRRRDLVSAAGRQAGGGHATLVRAAPAMRAAIAVFQPQAAALAALAARVKAELRSARGTQPRPHVSAWS